VAETQLQGGISSVGQSVLLVALKALIWHTDTIFWGRDEADSSAIWGSGETLNKHKGLS
jgi:hypothetical protein